MCVSSTDELSDLSSGIFFLLVNVLFNLYNWHLSTINLLRELYFETSTCFWPVLSGFQINIVWESSALKTSTLYVVVALAGCHLLEASKNMQASQNCVYTSILFPTVAIFWTLDTKGYQAFFAGKKRRPESLSRRGESRAKSLVLWHFTCLSRPPTKILGLCKGILPNHVFTTCKNTRMGSWPSS